MTPAEELLARTTQAVNQRRIDYGPPAEHFSRTAAMLNILFQQKLKQGESFCASDWAAAMVVDKLARSAGTHPIEDNIVDIAGYAACWFEAWRANKERAL